jgi:hypothetical protein
MNTARLIFRLEDECYTFLRNVGLHTDYTARYARRWQHSYLLLGGAQIVNTVRQISHLEDGGDTFLRNVGLHTVYTAQKVAAFFKNLFTFALLLQRYVLGE